MQPSQNETPVTSEELDLIIQGACTAIHTGTGRSDPQMVILLVIESRTKGRELTPEAAGRIANMREQMRLKQGAMSGARW